MIKPSTRKLVYGWGINDSLTPVRSVGLDGKSVLDQYYRTWANMLNRCFSAKFQAQYPTYIGCTVTEEWQYFTTFRGWMATYNHEGKHLDKDIIQPGNKVYSPDLCCFTSRQLNTLLGDCGAARGKWPVGVCFHKASGKFMAKIKKSGKSHHLGLFDTPESASAVYAAEKASYVTEFANEQPDPRIHAGLLKHANLIMEGAF